jgi:hypothetical protein
VTRRNQPQQRYQIQKRKADDAVLLEQIERRGDAERGRTKRRFGECPFYGVEYQQGLVGGNEGRRDSRHAPSMAQARGTRTARALRNDSLACAVYCCDGR